MSLTGLPQVRKWSGKKYRQGDEKVRDLYFESGKIDIFMKVKEN